MHAPKGTWRVFHAFPSLEPAAVAAAPAGAGLRAGRAAGSSTCCRKPPSPQQWDFSSLAVCRRCGSEQRQGRRYPQWAAAGSARRAPTAAPPRDKRGPSRGARRCNSRAAGGKRHCHTACPDTAASGETRTGSRPSPGRGGAGASGAAGPSWRAVAMLPEPLPKRLFPRWRPRGRFCAAALLQPARDPLLSSCRSCSALRPRTAHWGPPPCWPRCMHERRRRAGLCRRRRHGGAATVAAGEVSTQRCLSGSSVQGAMPGGAASAGAGVHAVPPGPSALQIPRLLLLQRFCRAPRSETVLR